MTDAKLRKLIAKAEYNISHLMPDEMTDNEAMLFYAAIAAYCTNTLAKWAWDEVKAEPVVEF